MSIKNMKLARQEQNRRMRVEILSGLEFLAILIFACGLPGWLETILIKMGV